jgi:hypothetical protein
MASSGGRPNAACPQGLARRGTLSAQEDLLMLGLLLGGAAAGAAGLLAATRLEAFRCGKRSVWMTRFPIVVFFYGGVPLRCVTSLPSTTLAYRVQLGIKWCKGAIPLEQCSSSAWSKKWRFATPVDDSGPELIHYHPGEIETLLELTTRTLTFRQKTDSRSYGGGPP